MKPYTNKDRWRHIKHFVDTHPYSEDNYRYLQDWLSHFETCDNCKWYEKDKYRCIIGSEECEWEPVEPMTTKPENLEECSHDRKTDDNDGKPNSPNLDLKIDHDSIPRKVKTYRHYGAHQSDDLAEDYKK